MLLRADLAPLLGAAILQPEDARGSVRRDVLDIRDLHRRPVELKYFNRFVCVPVRAMEKAALYTVIGFRLANF